MYTVLLVDDSASVRTLASSVLRSAGYWVLAVEDGCQALALAQAYPGGIDLLITDISMPRMSGIALWRAFTEFRPATPVLFISGDPANAITGEQFLAKPFTPGQLRSAVAALAATAQPAAVGASGVAIDHSRA